MESDKYKKLKMHRLLSILIAVIGILLMVFMITVESEPGAIPLLLIATGAGWFLITAYKFRSQHS